MKKLAAICVAGLLAVSHVAQADGSVVQRCVDIQEEPSLSGFHRLPEERTVPMHSTAINLNPGSGISSNQAALAAFNRAAQHWQRYLGDDVALNINIDMGSLASGVLGSTNPTEYYTGYTTMRDLVSGGGDTGSTAEAATLAYLPTASQYSAYVPNGFSLSGYMEATRANLLALGVPQSDMGGYGTADASITFSTSIAWDYDDSNGITPNTYSFESVATHEIGHVLGFISDVDHADYALHLAQTASLDFTPLDLFRFSSENVPTTSSQFTTNARDLMPGDTDYFSYVFGNILMSTGDYYGDGKQASHWKDNLGLGIMDPTFAPGEISLISPNDLVAMDLIGWQIVPEPGSWIMLFGAAGTWFFRRRRRRVTDR